jgi:hypothetical protein
MKIEHSEWTPITKLDVVARVPANYTDGNGHRQPGEIRLLTQDGTAHTPMYGPEFVEEMLRQGKPGTPIRGANLVYLAVPKPQEALVIGVGGGVDVVSARALGAHHITGVELNQATIDLVQERYRDLVQWPDWEGISLLCAEGRHFTKSTNQQYDTIVMSAIDTFSALNSGAYVLSENYLYTVEAIEDYMNCLKPGGAMSISLWLFQQPRESLRLANLYLNAAERLGVGEIDQLVFAIVWRLSLDCQFQVVDSLAYGHGLRDEKNPGHGQAGTHSFVGESRNRVHVMGEEDAVGCCRPLQ